jgi:hypothetical protein
METLMKNPLDRTNCLAVLFRVLSFLLLPICSFAQIPANNTCATASTITTATTCITGTSRLTGQTIANATTDNLATTCGVSNAQDVWYSFVAKTTFPVITVSNLGASWAGSMRIQLFSSTGPCAGLAQVSCGTSPLTPGSPLTIGNTYYVRIHKNTSTAPTGTGWTFDICITDPAPSNDNCSTPILITSNTVCSNTTGNMYGSTLSATAITPCTASIYDVWYSFVAQSFTSTINLSSIGSAINTPGLQVIDNCGTPVNYGCGTTSLTVSNLTVGSTYFIRVYAAGGTAPTSPVNAAFNICVTHPVPPVPANDECTGAVTLQNNSGCSSIWTNVMNATASSTAIAPCTGPVSYDVWYKFVAAVSNPTITLGGAANNFTSRRLQLFSGSCGSLIHVACGTTSIAATGLTPGATYYIRVYSNSGLAAPTGNGFFQLCVSSPGLAPKFGNSYVNITKKTSGGVVEQGDTLEIRMTINHTTGTVYSMRYLDSVPTNTQMITTPNHFIQVITNEGMAIPGKSFTTTAGDDAATYIANPPAGQYQIRMNLAFGSSVVAFPPDNTTTEVASATGQMIASTDIPKGTNNTMLFATAFRVRVTAVAGNTITLGMGKFIYKATVGGPDITLTATPYQILISQPMSLCANATGVNMSQEFGGTFGNGITLNRTTDLAYQIPGYTYVNINSLQGLGDGQYSIVKNISPRSGTNRLADRVGSCVAALPSQLACAQRMHGGHWDVDGDHSGTTNSIGNIPLAEGSNGGYMLMVNADYVASESYRQTINNLCPNTYYEFSAWVRNICATCGNDYTTGGNYSPTRTPGVLPNLTFALDDLDRYNSGEMAYGIGWVKKGFVFVTGPTQNQATFSIRNNSQGGGGNDWVIDDISVATCLPNMSYSPTLNPVVCQGNAFTIRDTIRSYFNNYRHHQWQRSTDGGVTWTDLGVARDSTPVFIAGAWQYITTYTIPPAFSTAANDGDLYRVLVATTNLNLSNVNCRVTDGISFISVTVEDCGIPLKTELLSFNGKLVNDRANLNWTTSKEDEAIQFIIERSADGVNFTSIATINSRNDGSSFNNYSFTDPLPVTDRKYYRVVLSSSGNKKTYSRTIVLSKYTTAFSLAHLINPFSAKLEFDIVVPADGKIDVQLTDLSGKILKRNSFVVSEGSNSLAVAHTDGLPAGLYILQISNKEEVITRKVVKKN